MPTSPDYSTVWGADPADLEDHSPTQEELEENEAAHQWLLAVAALPAEEPVELEPWLEEALASVEPEASTEEEPAAE